MWAYLLINTLLYEAVFVLYGMLEPQSFVRYSNMSINKLEILKLNKEFTKQIDEAPKTWF